MNSPSPSPSPRTAIVTGASAGLGREMARQLVLERGWTVLATARRLDRLEALAAELPPGRVRVLAGDLADPAFRSRLWSWAEAEAAPGGVDLLVNNAGLGHYDPLAEQDPANIERVVEVNLVALIDLTRLALGPMIARGSGQVLEVSSVLGYVGLPYSAVYVATKHAVNGLVKSLRYELRGTGVRVWAACPGRTRSEFFRVASGRPDRELSAPRGEPTDRVARGILRGLDRRGAFVIPTLAARGVVELGRWLPGPFDWFMGRWAPRHFAREIRAARLAGGPGNPGP